MVPSVLRVDGSAVSGMEAAFTAVRHNDWMRAMLKVAKQGAPKQVLENEDINSISQDGS